MYVLFLILQIILEIFFHFIEKISVFPAEIRHERGSLTHNFLNYFTREASRLFFLSN